MSRQHYTHLMWTLQSTDCTNRSRTAWIVSHSHRIGKSKLKLNRKRVVCHFPLSLVVTGLMIPTICCSALWYTTCKTRRDVWVIFIDSATSGFRFLYYFVPHFFFLFFSSLAHFVPPRTTVNNQPLSLAGASTEIWLAVVQLLQLPTISQSRFWLLVGAVYYRGFAAFFSFLVP